MGVTWKTPDQTTFLEGYITTYLRRAREGKLKEFWSELTKEWFKRFPLGEPSADSIKEEGSKEKAATVARVKKIKQIKRFFKGQRDSGLTGRQNLRLEDGRTRRLSEVQTYMSLFYESRIRETVLLRWAKDKSTYPGSITVPDLPQDGALAEDGHIFRDMRVPISYKNAIAQELWDVEDEVIKKQVRSRRESEPAFKTVYNTEGEERSELVREYAKNISSLQRNMGTVLRNVDRKCAGKGIMWIGCPSPYAGGKPIGYFQCVGEAPGGKDFEAFIGTEKAREFKALFGAWVQKVYPSSEWSMFTFDQTPDDPAAGDQTDTNEGEDNCDTVSSSDASPPVIPGPSQGNALSADCDSPITADDVIAKSKTVEDNAAGKSWNVEHDNAAAEPQTIEHDDPAVQSNIVQDQPLSPTLLASFASIPLPVADAHTQPPPLVQDEPLSPTLLASFASIPLPVTDAHTQPPPLVMAAESTPLREPVTPHSQPETINPSLLAAPVRRTARTRTSGRAPLRDPTTLPISGGDDPALFCLPTDVQGPTWMKKKGTIGYFRSVFKMGGLSTLISNWYRLEEVLGFPEQKTQKGLPMKTRPKVVATFLKNGHNYRRDYGLEARSLGREISTWWEEISTTSHAGYGGTTGIYTLVVLMTWWGTFLSDQPDSERASYLTVVEELNHAILAALQSNEKSSASRSSASQSLPAASSPSPQPNNHPAKRVHTEEPSSRKRLRT